MTTPPPWLGVVLGANYETGNVVSVGITPPSDDAEAPPYAVISKPADHAALGSFPGANPGRQEGP